MTTPRTNWTTWALRGIAIAGAVLILLWVWSTRAHVSPEKHDSALKNQRARLESQADSINILAQEWASLAKERSQKLTTAESANDSLSEQLQSLQKLNVTMTFAYNDSLDKVYNHERGFINFDTTNQVSSVYSQTPKYWKLVDSVLLDQEGLLKMFFCPECREMQMIFPGLTNPVRKGLGGIFQSGNRLALFYNGSREALRVINERLDTLSRNNARRQILILQRFLDLAIEQDSVGVAVEAYISSNAVPLRKYGQLTFDMNPLVGVSMDDVYAYLLLRPLRFKLKDSPTLAKVYKQILKQMRAGLS